MWFNRKITFIEKNGEIASLTLALWDNLVSDGTRVILNKGLRLWQHIS